MTAAVTLGVIAAISIRGSGAWRLWAAALGIVAGSADANLEDQLALLGEQVAGPPVEEEISLRLLRHYASSVRHQQFHDTDVVTVRVGPSASI